MTVTLDTHRVTSMCDQIGHRATGDMRPALKRAAEAGRSSITGIPVDTGRLAASPKTTVHGDEVLIVTDVPYARFVFGGTQYVPARPPNVHGDAIAKIASREVAREVFG